MSPETITDAVAATIWDNALAVRAGTRPPWSEAITQPLWAGRVATTREQAQLAVSASRNAAAAQALTEAAEALEQAARGRSEDYLLANREDCYVLKVRAAQYLDGER